MASESAITSPIDPATSSGTTLVVSSCIPANTGPDLRLFPRGGFLAILGRTIAIPSTIQLLASITSILQLACSSTKHAKKLSARIGT
ncbi:uncharacterized protein PAN0_008c3425 [Moesziomyces antarcticus]|uniref:Uncharacterized protein n=1 Tax=Pseudozyma antarctica TaxID=84753 RepID=A0A081CEW2_PSEA2|nr:uncharacterized protein PAN0_008c3425 [Moesziomyces antarcticus]GAK65208.1 hypothetical protein PAN0_008c3425 [Moesziomyces antarcticus]